MMATIYWLIDGVDVPPEGVEIPFGGGIVRKVRLGPARLPEGAYATSDDPEANHLLLKAQNLPEAFQRAMNLNHVEHAIVGGRTTVRIPNPPLNSMRLCCGVLEIECEAGELDSELIEDVRDEIAPFRELLSFSQRRIHSLADATVVSADQIWRFYETRQPSVSPENSYGKLVVKGHLGQFLTNALDTWAAMDFALQEKLSMANAFHSTACGQRAVLETRLVEHLSALDIVTDIVSGAARLGQLKQYKKAKSELLTSGWSEGLLPTDEDLKFVKDVRNDLAHPREWDVLSAGEPGKNREVIIRATETAVTLLEASILHLLGFPSADCRLCINLPFKLSGWAQWQCLVTSHTPSDPEAD